MPYPLQFRPNQKCDVFDADGTAVDLNIDIQLFRPMLAYRTNRLDDDNKERNVAGGQLHRFVLQSDLAAELAVGPAEWSSFGFPSYVLAEDPNGEHWGITDATVWDDPAGGEQLLAGFASKKRQWRGSPRPAPTASSAPIDAAEFMEWGQVYSFTLPGSSARYWRVDLRQQQGVTMTVLTQTNSAGRKMDIVQGSQLAPIHTLSPLGAVAFTVSVLSGTALSGAWGWFGFQNADPGPDDLTFIIRQGVSTAFAG